MISLPATFVALPLLLIVWVVDGLLFLCLLRRLLGPHELGPRLASWTQQVPGAVDRVATRLLGQVVPRWVAWLIGICALLVLRHALVAMALAVR